MDATSFGLTVLDICIKSGKSLYDFCQRYQNADHDIRESTLCIKTVWLKTEKQMEALKRSWDSLDEDVKLLQSELLSTLNDKLQNACYLLKSLDPHGDLAPSLRKLQKATGLDAIKLKYAAFTNRKLEKITADLETWHNRWDPTWFLLLARVVDPMVSQKSEGRDISIVRDLHRVQRENVDPTASQSSIFLPHEFSIRKPERVLTSTCTTFGYNAGQAVIIDSLSTDGKDIQQTTKDVRDVARILAVVDPKIFGLLKCKGVVRKYDSSRVSGFDIIFTVPEGLTNPRSLRGLLLTTDGRPTLDSRFRLAKLLASSISFLHTAQIVHKNISPETVVVLEDPKDQTETPFLVGFEKFRRAEGQTYMSGDVDWEKNLYRHPRRQGTQPEEMYKMQHDIYSLGVCLLEIGLGFSFVDFDPKASSDQNLKGAIPNPMLEIAEHLKNKDMRARAFGIKHRLVAMAENNLLGSMGKVYTNVVISCLTCLDKDNQGFGDEKVFTDEDGVLVGIRYIEKVLFLLEEVKF